MLISLDTETTGIDLAHGARPFLVTTCCDDGTIRYWEWDVDPYTRCPEIPDDDLADIAALMDAAELIYLQNAKFDARALATVGLALPWEKVRDTLCMGHLLASNHRHDLTWMCIEYLGCDIEPYEVAVKEVTRAARAIARRDYPAWRLADEGVEGMPSVSGGSKRDEDKPWKNDMWLPRALAKFRNFGPQFDEGWLGACSRYANADSEHTLYLGLEMERLIRERGYWSIYMDRLHLPRIACEMESYGVTARGDFTSTTVQEYEAHVAEAEAALEAIAAERGHALQLAAGAALNDNMREFFYGMQRQRCPRCDWSRTIKHWNGDQPTPGGECPKCIKGSDKRPGVRSRFVNEVRENLGLPVIVNGKTGRASLDKEAMGEYLTTLDEGPALQFIELLADKRMYDTALTYMHAYQRFWVPTTAPGYYRIHPSLNPFGTDHLRWASNSPNMQNVSGESKELSNRACFGPAPGREWWAMDFKSIEARIPAYESGEPKMIEVFERPDSAPYWGSLYLLSASVLYPEEFWPCAQVEGEFREKYPRLYKQAKFFVLAKNYGAGRRKGDLLSRVHNSYDLVDNEFPRLAALQQKYLADADRTGWVQTLPDRTVDPTRGYPVLASHTEDGRVLTTTPFNYHISGTACWVKNRALIKCSAQLAAWRAEGFDAHVALEVHDELLFDFPRGTTLEENLPRALILKRLMESCGADLIPAIPTPVSVEYHAVSWAEGVAV